MNIAAVVVTFNRLNLLKRSLAAIEQQRYSPSSIIIVDNCSTDGTAEFLAEWANIHTAYQKHVVRLDSNLGGSGGFHYGLKTAMNLAPDWVWLADDDAFPEPDAFELFVNHQETYASMAAAQHRPLGAVCSAVINEGEIDEIHRRRTIIKHGFVQRARSVKKSEYAKNVFAIDLFTYVGVFIKHEVLTKVGITEKDYFIWYDDSEHAMRISAKYSVFCDASVRINHNVPAVPNEITWKTFYGERNRMLMFKKHHYPTYLYRVFKCLLYAAGLQKGTNRVMRLLKWRAVCAAALNRQGVHEAYKPGQKLL